MARQDAQDAAFLMLLLQLIRRIVDDIPTDQVRRAIINVAESFVNNPKSVALPHLQALLANAGTPQTRVFAANIARLFRPQLLDFAESDEAERQLPDADRATLAESLIAHVEIAVAELPIATADTCLFEQLDRQCESLIRSLQRRLHLTEQLARDLVQDAFLKLVPHVRTHGHPDKNPAGWFFTTICHVVGDYLRRRGVSTRQVDDLDDRALFDERPEAPLMYQETLDKLRRELGPSLDRAERRMAYTARPGVAEAWRAVLRQRMSVEEFAASQQLDRRTVCDRVETGNRIAQRVLEADGLAPWLLHLN
jgi:RNA polymerase sigma factor (sigma-70 family)